MKLFLRATLLLLFGMGSRTQPIHAGQIPEPILPHGVGINIHFTRGHEKDLDLIAAAGFKFARMDFSWGGTERKPGEYDWSAYDELTANLEKRGLKALYILDYSNGLYEETILSRSPLDGREYRSVASPRHPASVAAFARWAAAAVKHFAGQPIIWEIWNEPNIGFWKPAPEVQQYIALAQATIESIRQVDPQATIVAPASSGFPWEFLESMFKAGLLEGLDAVSVHPYRNYSLGPETALADYQQLRGLIEQYAPAEKQQMPILSGEWGYATHEGGGVSLQTQAAFIARQQLINLWHGVPLSIWYDWKNDGTDAHEKEHHFGTVSHDLQLKPSYLAAQTLTRELAGYHIARRLHFGSADDYVLLLVNSAGDQKLAAWTTDQARRVHTNIPLDSPDSAVIANGQGAPLPTAVQDGQLQLSLQSSPQYVTFKTRLPPLTAAACWSVGPRLSRIAAGKRNAFSIPVRLQNPFPNPIRVYLTLAGLEPNPVIAWKARISAGEAVEHLLRHGTEQRWPRNGFLRLNMRIEMEDTTGSVSQLGEWSDTLDFTIANPLELNLAPVESGMQLTIANPAREDFSGTIRSAAKIIPVRLSQQHPDAIVPIPGIPNGGKVELLNDEGIRVAQLESRRFQSMALTALKTILDGDAQVPAEASLDRVASPEKENAPYAEAWKLHYQFEAGWRFVRIAMNGSKPLLLEGNPRSLGLWIYGDNSGNTLRIRLTDSEKQTFQPNGPKLDWQGWRWVEFDLADLKKAGHWGGADDGVVRGSLRLDTLLLIDGSRQKTSGTVYFAGPALIY